MPKVSKMIFELNGVAFHLWTHTHTQSNTNLSLSKKQQHKTQQKTCLVPTSFLFGGPDEKTPFYYPGASGNHVSISDLQDTAVTLGRHVVVLLHLTLQPSPLRCYSRKKQNRSDSKDETSGGAPWRTQAGKCHYIK